MVGIQKYFEKDAALARRFQVVKVEEPDEEKAAIMMRGFAATLEKHHNLRVLDEAITDAVRLSSRYIAGRQLPDKSVSLLDTACARVAIGHCATPGEIEDLRREIDAVTVQIDILQREAVAGAEHGEKLGELNERRPSPKPSSPRLRHAGSKKPSWSRRFAKYEPSSKGPSLQRQSQLRRPGPHRRTEQRQTPRQSLLLRSRKRKSLKLGKNLIDSMTNCAASKVNRR